jgi:hypothetical protein
LVEDSEKLRQRPGTRDERQEWERKKNVKEGKKKED